MAIKPKPTAEQPAATGGVGLTDESFVEGGGLQDDFDGTILECAFVEWDYDGKYDPGLFLAVEIQNDEEEVEEGKNPFIQYYSAGDLAHFVPSDDGKEAIPVGSKTGLSKNCNAVMFLLSTIEAGFDKTLIGARVDVFEGAKFHFKRKPQPDRKGLDRQDKKAGKATDEKRRLNDVLCCEKLIAMPGEAATTPGPKPGPTAVKPAAPKPATTAAPPAASKKGPAVTPQPPPPAKTLAPAAAPTNDLPDEDTQTWAGVYITTLLEAHGGTHPKIGLAAGVVNWAKEQGLAIPVRNKVIQALGNEAFLSQTGLGWVFDGENLTAE